MKAMILSETLSMEKNKNPLKLVDLPVPEPKDNEILVSVSTCGVCHTELDEIEGRTAPPEFPIIPGHEVVGRVEKKGPLAARFKTGDRVGIGWIYSSCGTCRFCASGSENLQRGGRLVINAIRKEDLDKEYLLKMDYRKHLWLEKEIKSVANVTRKDIGEFLSLAATIPIKPETQEYRLDEANTALLELKSGRLRGAKVLVI